MQWCVSDLKIITFFNITALFALCELECKTLCFILVITRAVTQISAVHTSLTRSTHAKLCDQTDLAVRRSTRRQSADFFYQLQKYFNWIAPISYSLVERWSQANSSRGSWDVHAKICARTHPLVPRPREIDVYFSREGVVYRGSVMWHQNFMLFFERTVPRKLFLWTYSILPDILETTFYSYAWSCRWPRYAVCTNLKFSVIVLPNVRLT